MNENPLDRYLPESARDRIEQAFYTRINAQATLESLIQDPDFWSNAAKHPAFFSDHGVVHVRDIARQMLLLLRTINGVLIPWRDPPQMESFMYGYGVMLAYLHDIGMSDLSSFGRAMHPEFAAQIVFTDSLEDIIEILWNENCGNIAWRLTKLFQDGILKRAPQIVFRELLSLSVGHSKSKVPVTILDDAAALRAHMQFILSHSLNDLYRQQQIATGQPVGMALADEPPPPFLERYYVDFEREAFDWLVAESVEARQLVGDVTDALRALRCGDALRQRGTVQKTSGGYEVFVSQQTGHAVFALRLGSDKLYLLELPDKPMSVGDANIASSEFSVDGNLRISFQRGAYASEEALQRSAYYTALMMNDFLHDIVDSFWRGATVPASPLKTSSDIQILLESTDDNPRFVELVQAQLRQFNPALDDQIQIVPSLRNVSELERVRYLEAKELDWGLEQRQEIMERVKCSGQKITHFDLVEGFKHVHSISLQAGETLIEAGAPAAFVYLPLGGGLKIIPLGGYQAFSVAAWMPLGNTGVIRGAIRNADVVAEQDVSLLIIPKETYLRHWYAPYTTEELKALLKERP